MANDVSIKDTTANTMLDAITTAIGASGFLRIYDGTMPATADTALSGNTVLAELPLSATFAAGAASGVLTASAITTDASANATGTATFFSLVTSAGVRIVDGTVGTSGADLNLNTTSIVAAASVAVTSLTITIS
jgi:hypothetical protein